MATIPPGSPPPDAAPAAAARAHEPAARGDGVARGSAGQGTTARSSAGWPTRRPVTPEEQAYVALQRLVTDLGQGVNELLRGANLSGAQYNVLRILRGAGPAGLPCGEIGARLITRDPDITRLLDRLERRALVSRARQSGDRRVVLTRVTDEGLAILAELDEPMESLHAAQLGHLGEDRLVGLMALLEAAAPPAGAATEGAAVRPSPGSVKRGTSGAGAA